MNQAGTAIVVLGKIEKLLLTIGRKQQEFQAIKEEMEQRIAAVRTEYADRLQGRADTIGKLEAQLREICEADRARLLNGKHKCINTLFGRVGWRKGRDGLAQDPDKTTESIAQALIKRGYKELVYIKYSPNISAILKALKNGRIGERVLAAAGLIFRPAEEQWYYHVDKSTVQQYLTEHGDEEKA